MPAKIPKPRIAIYLKPHVYETIKRLSELNGEPMSRIVSEMVEAVADPLMRTVALLEAAASAPKQIKDGLRGTLEAVERDIYGAVGYSISQMDWLTDQMKGGGGGKASKLAAASPPSGFSDPHHVIRGSALGKPLKTKETVVLKKRVKKGGKNG